MTAVSKKSRIITRSRYRRTDLLRQGKCRCAAFTDLLCCAPRSPLLRKGEGKVRIQFKNNCIRQVLELARAVQNRSPSVVSPWTKERGEQTGCHAGMFAQARFEIAVYSQKGKLRRAAGQARLRRSTEFLLSLIDSQRLACVLQAFVVVISPAAHRITHQ